MKHAVYSLLKTLPRGKVTTYGELARASGIHSRTVGMLMRSNSDPENIPCYRVVHSDGSVGGYSAKNGIELKIHLLENDGIAVKNGKVDLKRYMHEFSKS